MTVRFSSQSFQYSYTRSVINEISRQVQEAECSYFALRQGSSDQQVERSIAVSTVTRGINPVSLVTDCFQSLSDAGSLA